MGISNKYKKVLSDLYSSEGGLLVYTLYSRYGVEPSEAIDFIRHYQAEEIITVDDNDRIRLTSGGKKKIVSLLKDLDIRGDIMNYSYLQSVKTGTSIRPFAPYLPTIEFYERYNKDKEKDDVPTSK